jgi:hypothetical protein
MGAIGRTIGAIGRGAIPIGRNGATRGARSACIEGAAWWM